MNYKNFINSSENQKLLMITHFKTWARFTYGSNGEEQNEEFGVGLLYRLSMSGLEANIESVGGLNTFIKEKGWQKLK